jgi:RNA polymerase-binding transcription factor DksA
MAVIDTDAREVLSRRRKALVQAHASTAGAPDARWTDYDATLPPLSEAVRREIEDIDAALQRIGDGRYGLCLACGGPIGLQRLRAIPEVRYCLSCSGRPPAG